MSLQRDILQEHECIYMGASFSGEYKGMNLLAYSFLIGRIYKIGF